jgi:hypothetical protein
MKLSLITLLTLFISTGAVFAQGGGSPRAQALPLQGKELPEVSGFDADGEPFAIRDKLKGQHTVLVFGCLT